MPINKFRGQYFFLSNFYPCREGVVYDGDPFPTSEHAYQAAKIEERPGRESFTCGGSLGDNPMNAKAKGGKVKMRPDWDRMKVDVMLEVVRSKFGQDTSLQQKLLSTQNQQLVEGHTGDMFWGGRANHLGNILMRVREELRVQNQHAATQTNVEEDPADTSPQPKQRSKGNIGRQSLFQDQLNAWIDSDNSTDDEIATQVENHNEVSAMSNSFGGANKCSLPSRFTAWLRSALEQELSPADVDSLMCSVEVILGGPDEDLSEALQSAAELLAEEGASVTSDALEVQWACGVAG